MKVWIEKYLVNTNLWVAVCFTCLLAFFQLGFYEVNYFVLGIVFFGTLSVYNFTRVTDIYDFLRFKSIVRPRIFLTYFGLIGTLLCVILRGFEMKTFVYLGFLGLVSFCYSLPFSGIGLRTIPFLKLFLISFVWAGSSVGLLLMVHHELIHHKMIFTAVFLFVAGITIPFDIRDRNTDSKRLKTIPMVIGFKNSKILAVIFLLLSGLFFYFETPESGVVLLSWLAAIVFSLGGIINTKDSDSNFYFSFWMESCSLIPLVTFLLLNK